MTTPHHVGQVAKARIEIAGLLEEWNSVKTDERAQTIVERMQALGWTAPPDPNADVPPLRPAQVADDDSPGRQAFRTGLCDRYGHQPDQGRCARCGTPLTDRRDT